MDDVTDELGQARWRKSSFSGGDGSNCVEVAHLAGGKALRDSKNRTGPVLLVPHAEWTAFLDDLRTGRSA
ncbi:DUF397 domain-containing protein [Sphaerisporangium sp. TRM90804]|uniref:DUF397 domain-containing protein n=1 Tax=Sphaerisporangium sp. TRM90804 TaxID=3031113 RepID=UPI00244C3B02|nr:DUF397 domain-containing protein [Sphaerisporangium sp. TRM90804]MDH2428743.1 DUF397 domain-containing protein [Sphaerisporangium sp. TRM90804]